MCTRYWTGLAVALLAGLAMVCTPRFVGAQDPGVPPTPSQPDLIFTPDSLGATVELGQSATRTLTGCIFSLS